jgi:L-ascorbate metabolism protein UlaG (beta-lactamase superfamily)
MTFLRYLGHAGFEIRNTKRILIDPYFSGNDLAPTYGDKPDLILVTHEHFDHYDKRFISRFNCPVVSPPEVRHKGGVSMKAGETRSFDGVTVHMFSVSHHQSTCASGFLIEYEGKRIVHVGDTYLDGVKELSSIDVLLVPTGGQYTMDICEALKALKILKPKLTVPMHFDTFPEIRVNPKVFKDSAERDGFRVDIMKVGESMVI